MKIYFKKYFAGLKSLVSVIRSLALSLFIFLSYSLILLTHHTDNGSLNGTLLKAISVSRFCEQRIKCYSCFYFVKVSFQVSVLKLRLRIFRWSIAKSQLAFDKCLISIYFESRKIVDIKYWIFPFLQFYCAGS